MKCNNFGYHSTKSRLKGNDNMDGVQIFIFNFHLLIFDACVSNLAFKFYCLDACLDLAQACYKIFYWICPNSQKMIVIRHNVAWFGSNYCTPSPLLSPQKEENWLSLSLSLSSWCVHTPTHTYELWLHIISNWISFIMSGKFDLINNQHKRK